MAPKKDIEDWATRPINLDHKEKLETIPNFWMVRKCDSYYDEYKHCRQLRGRFHQLYVYGKAISCEEWNDNFQDCKKWSKNADEEAVNRLIQREKSRIAKRLEGHFKNDVWERRSTPPDDWNKPLPEHLAEACEKSYLKTYVEEREEGTGASVESKVFSVQSRLATALPSCAIM